MGECSARVVRVHHRDNVNVVCVPCECSVSVVECSVLWLNFRVDIKVGVSVVRVKC